MEQHVLMDALVQTRRINNQLNEVLDLSRQLAEALNRNDQVTIRMLIAMRQEPIDRLTGADQALRQLRDALPEADRERLVQLLNGQAAGTPEEAPLANQVASNARLLQQVVELDKGLSRKLAREKSIYQGK